MDQISLYRKYRPHNFDNLVGQDHVKTTLMNALKSGHVAHAYLFTGPRGTGKTSTARLIAKALNCNERGEAAEPCDKCELCEDINSGRLIDLIEIDAASNRGIDEVRALKETIGFAPSRSAFKVYIIDEVHMMTKEAFNALLKTLEEPPEHAYFILATTEVHKIPDTIISRCQRFDFRRMSMKALMTRLSYICQKEGVKAEDEALEAISRYVNGGMRDAIGLLEQLTVDGSLKFAQVQDILGLSSVTLLDELYKALMSEDSSAALKIVHELHDQGSDLKQFTHEFIDKLRQEMLAAVRDGKNVSRLIEMIEIFQEAEGKLGFSIPQLPLEIAVIKVAGSVGEAVTVEAKAEVGAKEVPIVEKKATPVAKVAEKVVEKKPAEVEKKVVEVSAEREHKNIADKKVEAKAEGVKEAVEDRVDIPFDLAHFKEHWPRVTERIKAPSLRMSIKSARAVKLEGSAVTLQFETNFHKDKVMEHDNRVALEAIVKEIFNHGVKIVAIVKAFEIKATIEEEKEAAPKIAAELEEAVPMPSEAPPAQEAEAADATVKSALDIFGGELVD